MAMARAKSRFTQAEVTKLLKAARGTSFDCVAIEVSPSTGRLRATYSKGPVVREEPSALQAWKNKRALERDREGATAFADAAGRTPAPAIAELMSEEEWITSVRSSELSNRERKALEALYERRGKDVPSSEIKGAGITTQKSLQARGYASIKMDGDRFISWRLTKEGEAFFAKLISLPPHF
jgi:hypothetical protein